VGGGAGDRFPSRYRHKLRAWPYRVGAFKIDYALDGPVPWADAVLNDAGTVHLGGTSAEMAAAEMAVHNGRIPEQPFVLLAQTSRFDPTRAPAGKHTLWAYCHVPAGSTVDMSDAIEAQIERFAPGFRDLILARSRMGPADLESMNANLVDGNVIGGSHAGLRLLFRPRVSLHPHRTPDPHVFIGSASTPPGGGVHGMGGWWAAHEVLRTTLR
jgi:phytoene dehydrogenase-like protein